MDEEDMIHIKWNITPRKETDFQSVVVRWMTPEPVIQRTKSERGKQISSLPYKREPRKIVLLASLQRISERHVEWACGSWNRGCTKEQAD